MSGFQGLRVAAKITGVRVDGGDGIAIAGGSGFGNRGSHAGIVAGSLPPAKLILLVLGARLERGSRRERPQQAEDDQHRPEFRHHNPLSSRSRAYAVSSCHQKEKSAGCINFGITRRGGEYN